MTDILQIGLRRAVTLPKLKAALEQLSGIAASKQYLFWEDESDAGKLLGLSFVADHRHDFGTRFTIWQDLTGTVQHLIADPLAELNFAKRLSQLLEQDVLISGFTTSDTSEWLLIKPDGSVWSVRENPDNEADYLELYEADAVPFDEQRAAVSAD